MLINNQYYINFANLNENKSLYMGAYMVLTNTNNTKHYYIEGERVCTKIGGGFGPGPNIPVDGELPLIQDDYETVQAKLWDMTMRFVECSKGPEISIRQELDPCHNDGDNFEELQYFYHSDHLGSSSFITDATGYAVQHLQYLPFGETFVDQQNGYDSRYTFSAKEKDDETQYSYFGARYYDSDLSVWLSVDPMSDERSWISPYNYCQWNPVGRVDPTGLTDIDDGYTIDDDGYITRVDDTGGDDFDVLYRKDDYERSKALTKEDGTNKNSYGNPEPSNQVRIGDTGILPELEKTGPLENYYKDTPISAVVTQNKSDAFKIFYFAAKNSNVEWQIDGYYSNNQNYYVLGTAHNFDHTYRSDDNNYGFGFSLSEQNFDLHSHKNTTELFSNGDQSVWTSKYYSLKGIRLPANHYCYNVMYGKLTFYNAWEGITIRNVNSSTDLHHNLGF